MLVFKSLLSKRCPTRMTKTGLDLTTLKIKIINTPNIMETVWSLLEWFPMHVNQFHVAIDASEIR